MLPEQRSPLEPGSRGSLHCAREARLHWVSAPHVAPSIGTPPGQKCSKGTGALAGAWGVLPFPRHGSGPSRLWDACPRLGVVTTALYRRYRPDTFADVVGQDHVTEPLRQALRADRVNHAYLFSGPRGCGKTTSARILARALNCAQGPTDTPCGTCDSCTELARGGSGSVDVVEIDAASHNGVDDARELRERAAFAPARDKYKIFILDEAHMVTPQGFNALLKLVEEPPPHVRFIFATTEPDKVISTIRSRTHHYPFRLVPPAVLTDYLQSLCEAEGVKVESGVLPLVVRAGGGSVRDSLSVLDQLMAGSDAGGVTYDRAIALLGFTDATLLDDTVDAIAAADGASLFSVVERVIQTGHEPRRFVEDLLERLRDVVVLCAAGKEGTAALAAVPEDQLEQMKTQARNLGLARASQSADLVADALTAMTGATSPRLHLELLCARLLAAAGAGAPGVAPAPRPTEVPAAAPAPVNAPQPNRAPATVQTAKVDAPAAKPASQPAAAQQAPARKDPEPKPPVAEPGQADPMPPAAGAVAATGADSEMLRRRWPEVLGTLERRRVTWVLVSQSAQVASVDDDTVTLAFEAQPLADRFGQGNHAENVSLAIRETLGLKVRVVATAGAPGPAPTPAAPTSTPPPTASASASPPSAPPVEDAPEEEDVSADDASAPDASISGAAAVADLLGGTVIDDK